MDPSYTVYMNVKLFIHFGQEFGSFLKHLNEPLPCDLAISLLGIYPKEVKSYLHTKTRVQMFIADLFVITKIVISPNVHQQANG